MRKLQIGVIGSMSDLAYEAEAETVAYNVGAEIAKTGYILVFGAEKDSNSLPTIAAGGARAHNGLTVGITYDKGLEVFDNEAYSVTIATGLVRGGGRELVQALSCDGIIAISGGSGTLNEICVAYQANIPVVVLSGFGGWSDKLGSTYLDLRNRYMFKECTTAASAVSCLIEMVQ